MPRSRSGATGVLLALVLLAIEPSPISGGARHFRVDWEPGGVTLDGQVIRGHIRSDYGMAASNIRVVVDRLDRNGALTNSAVRFVPGTVPPFGSIYFKITVDETADAYRVYVTSWDWIIGGGP